METLEELKNTYKKLQKESNRIYSKIKILEKQDKISKFTVGDCYLDRIWNNLLKIVSIKNNFIYYICLDDGSISRESIYVFDIELWERITSEQFKNAYRALMKDIQDPDFGEKTESNWITVYKSIMNSINS